MDKKNNTNKPNNNITKLEVVKNNDYYGFNRRGNISQRRGNDDLLKKIEEAANSNESEFKQKLKISEKEKEHALDKIKELEAKQEALNIPLNEHVLYYGSLGVSLFFLIGLYITIIIRVIH